MADVKIILGCVGRCYANCSRWNGHCGNQLNFGCCCVNVYGWQMEQALLEILSHTLMNHACWCYTKVADGKATITKGWMYFHLSSEVLNWATSQVWGILCLPMFLFRDRLFIFSTNRFFDGSNQVLVLPSYNSEFINDCCISMWRVWGQST